MAKKGTSFLLLGLLLMVAALFFALYNIWDSNRAGKAAGAVVEALREEMQETVRPGSRRDQYEFAPVVYPEISLEEPSSEPELPSMDPEMAVLEENGHEYIGILDIPSLDLSLPVMAQWDYNKLEIAPCIYTGTYFSDDLVICGHNYISQLGSLWWISIGAEVYLTTVDGYVYCYVVDNVETVQPTEIDRMITGTDWDLTLFTCYSGGTTRCAVRCSLIL